MSGYDVNKIRKDFPILQTQIYGKPLVYLDNAATTQKPQCVISAIDNYYTEINSNVHRGVHFLSEKATSVYESARETIRKYINAAVTREIIFVRGTTEAINLVANSYGNEKIRDGDEIIISTLEHHSNIVPWQMLCERKNAVLRIIPIYDEGELIFEEYEKLFNERTKFVSISHVSNSLGTINPVKQIIDEAHKHGVPVMIDGAQAVQHLTVDVKELNADFYAFSGHKLYGPTGIGVLYGKEKLLETMPPYQGGGDMIKNVSFEKTIYNDLPYKFEAGTPDISGAIGLAAAINYVTETGIDNIAKHEKEVLEYATGKMLQIDGMRIIGTAKEKSSVLSFLIGNIHPYDAGTILDRLGVAIRTGVHCTEPLMDRLGIPGTARASFAMYSTKEEVDLLVEGAEKARKMLS